MVKILRDLPIDPVVRFRRDAPLLAMFHAWELATDTYRRLNRFQRTMARLGIPKKSTDAVDPANSSDP